MSPEFARKVDRQTETEESLKNIEQSMSNFFVVDKMKDEPGHATLLGTVLPSFEKGGISMGGAKNQEIGVGQKLKAMIVAGTEVMFVIEGSCDNDDGSTSNETFVARHFTDGRSEIVTVLEPGVVNEFGRNSDNGYSSGMSRKHFGVAMNDQGAIAIADLKSTNGTKVYYPKAGYSDEPNPNNPISNINFWSVKSKDVKNFVTGEKASK